MADGSFSRNSPMTSPNDRKAPKRIASRIRENHVFDRFLSGIYTIIVLRQGADFIDSTQGIGPRGLGIAICIVANGAMRISIRRRGSAEGSRELCPQK